MRSVGTDKRLGRSDPPQHNAIDQQNRREEAKEVLECLVLQLHPTGGQDGCDTHGKVPYHRSGVW